VTAKGAQSIAQFMTSYQEGIFAIIATARFIDSMDLGAVLGLTTGLVRCFLLN
jgi:hypothetical protein